MLAFRSLLFWAALIAVQALAVGYFFLFMGEGMQKYTLLKNQRDILEQKVDLLRKEVEGLQAELQEWKEHPFLKEELARKNLQMGYAHEKVYRLS